MFQLRARPTMKIRRELPQKNGDSPPFFRSFTITPATHRSTKHLVEYLSKAIDEGKKGLAVELLRLFDSHVEGLDISASKGRDGIRVTHALRGVVDLASFGDGMRRSAALALALVRSQGGLLLVDEIEAGIHPRLLPEILSRLIRAAQAADVQILATTHSLEAIDSLIEALGEFPNCGAAYYIKRDQKGHLICRYDQKKMIELREGGLDLR
jgi:predicted ATPase